MHNSYSKSRAFRCAGIYGTHRVIHKIVPNPSRLSCVASSTNYGQLKQSVRNPENDISSLIHKTIQTSPPKYYLVYGKKLAFGTKETRENLVFWPAERPGRVIVIGIVRNRDVFYLSLWWYSLARMPTRSYATRSKIGVATQYTLSRSPLASFSVVL